MNNSYDQPDIFDYFFSFIIKKSKNIIKTFQDDWHIILTSMFGWFMLGYCYQNIINNLNYGGRYLAWEIAYLFNINTINSERLLDCVGYFFLGIVQGLTFYLSLKSLPKNFKVSSLIVFIWAFTSLVLYIINSSLYSLYTDSLFDFATIYGQIYKFTLNLAVGLILTCITLKFTLIQSLKIVIISALCSTTILYFFKYDMIFYIGLSLIGAITTISLISNLKEGNYEKDTI